jgi:hypothetical protein
MARRGRPCRMKRSMLARRDLAASISAACDLCVLARDFWFSLARWC